MLLKTVADPLVTLFHSKITSQTDDCLQRMGNGSGANEIQLESDYVPLLLRDVVREYFTSLEPTGGK